MKSYMNFLIENKIIKEVRSTSTKVEYAVTKVKDVISKVNAKVSGRMASKINKVLGALNDLKEQSEKIKKELEETSKKAKEMFSETFDSEELLNQLIITTAKFSATLAKATVKEASEKVVVNHEKAWDDLYALLDGDMKARAIKILGDSTEIVTIERKEQDIHSRGLRVKKIDEAFSVKGLLCKIKKTYQSLLSFKDKLTKKLDKIMDSVKGSSTQI